ncbi:MAG: DUF1631 family protein [Gammaproteobacteria bacterium]|nr:DUF1631 family protein [Gammaproteobacteria bacterium]
MKRSINQLLSPVYSIIEQWFSEHLIEFSEFAIAKLMEKSELSNSISIQSECFSAIHSIQAKTNSAIPVFISSLGNKFLTTEHKYGLPEGLIDISHEKVKLNLVATRDLEENLAFDIAVEKLTKQNQEAFEHLETRIYKLLKNSGERLSENPISADNILSAFRDSMNQFNFSSVIRVEIYKLFEQFLSTHIPDLLQRLNEHLINRGILPKIETDYFVKKQPDSSGSDESANSEKKHQKIEPHSQTVHPDLIANRLDSTLSSNTPDIGTPAPFATPSSSASSQRSNSLSGRHLDLAKRLSQPQSENPLIKTPDIKITPAASSHELQTKSHGSHINSSTAPSNKATMPNLNQIPGYFSSVTSRAGENNLLALKQAYLNNKKHNVANFISSTFVSQHDISTGELINAVTGIQYNSPANPGSDNLPTASVHKQIKENILASTNKSPETTQLKHSKLYLIDLIEDLFGHISENKKLSLTAKYLFRNLMLPIIHLSLVDESFIDDEQHPARLFLNDFADASLGITDENSRTNNPLYLKLENVATQLTHKNKVNKIVFTEIHADLKRFIEYRKQQANTNSLSSRATIETKIDAILKHTIKDKKLPDDGIALILNKVWKNVMLNIYFDDNCDDGDWDRATAFINSLLLSIKPAQTLAEKKRLAKLIPIISHELEDGLIRVNYPYTVKTKLIQHLKKHHLVALGKTGPVQQIKAPEQNQHKSGGNEKYNGTPAIKKDLQADSMADEVESIYQTNVPKPSPIIVASFEEAFTENITQKTKPTNHPIGENNPATSVFDTSEPDPTNPHRVKKNRHEKDAHEKLSKTDFELIRLVNKCQDMGLIADQYTDAVKSLQVDAWLEFRFKSHFTRAKITWIKEDHSQFNCLTQNNRIIELTLETLSDCFRQGIGSAVQSYSIIEDAITAASKDIQP